MTESTTPTTTEMDMQPVINLSTDSSSPPPLTYNLKLTLPEDVYAELMRGDPSKVIELVKTITPPPAKKLYNSWKDVKKVKNKVAIVGFADSRDQAPYKDDSFEIWGLNSLFEMIPMDHVTRWFEIHDIRMHQIDTNKEIGFGLTRTGQPYLEALARLQMPIYMTEDYPNIPNSIRYPLEEMISEFDPMQRHMEFTGPFKKSVEYDFNGYFTNSISFMIALAIHDMYEEINVFGVDMATSQGSEYAYQRPSCEYYLGIAQGRGIKVYIPNEADLLKTRYIYGFELVNELAFAAKMNKLNQAMNGRYNVAVQNRDMAIKQMDQYIGALEASKEINKIWASCNYPEQLYKMFDKFIETQQIQVEKK